MARVGMKRAVGQARRATESLLAFLEAPDPQIERFEQAWTETLVSLKQLGDLWEGAADVRGVVMSRCAIVLYEHLQDITLDELKEMPQLIAEHELRFYFRRLGEQANRLFPGN